MNHLEWGKDLTQDQMHILRNGGASILNDRQGIPFIIVRMDMYGQFWQYSLPEPLFGE